MNTVYVDQLVGYVEALCVVLSKSSALDAKTSNTIHLIKKQIEAMRVERDANRQYCRKYHRKKKGSKFRENAIQQRSTP